MKEKETKRMIRHTLKLLIDLPKIMNFWSMSSFDVCQSIYGSIDKCKVVIAGLSVRKINGGAACTFIKTEKRLSDFEQAFHDR